jgi:hypothetical protein
MKNKMLGRIEFTTQTSLALWEEEIKGQLSDGAWENARPYDHYKFWHQLDSAVGYENKVILYEHACSSHCMKNRYNLAVLYQYVVDRMLATGRMASVNNNPKMWALAEDMPDTLTEFLDSKKTSRFRSRSPSTRRSMV